MSGVMSPATGSCRRRFSACHPSDTWRRPPTLRAAALRLAVTAVCVVSAAACTATGGRTTCADPVQARALGQLSSYVGWLSRNHVKGYVGEVGWPAGADSARWNALAKAWYGAADAAGLPVTAWAAGEAWPASYPLAIYRSAAAWRPLSVRGPQAAVVERHTGSAAAPGGVADPGGSFGADLGSYSAQQPGAYGQAYAYPSRASFDYLAARGLRLVRLAFTWERIQPALNAPLSPTELGRLRAAVQAAHAAGLAVVLDLHSYARYRIARPDGKVEEEVLGSPQLPSADLADVWRRLALAFRSAPGIWGYGLMNEPHDLPGARGGASTWETASQQAVDAIRATSDPTQVLVAGASWSKVADWPATHPRAWIHDPIGAVRYEAHQYFDGDGSGQYVASYQAEAAAARRAGYSREC